MTVVSRPATSCAYPFEDYSTTPWWELDLNRQANRRNKVPRMGNVPYGFTWKPDDENTDNWLPQGVTGLRKGDKKTVVVSWYCTRDDVRNDAVRLSFVDLATLEYRHVILVTSVGGGIMTPVRSHAGGIATLGHKIYVAQTNFGILEFDAEQIWEADDRAGSTTFSASPTTIKAYGYEYVMPMRRSWCFADVIRSGANEVPTFSYLSRIWTDDDSLQLLSGNFHTHDRGDGKYDNAPSRAMRWALDPDTGDLSQVGDIISLNCQFVQGAAWRRHDAGETLYLSRSYGQTRYKLYVVDPSKYNRTDPLGGFKKYDKWPARSEDLFLSSTDHLWCCTETKSTDGASLKPRITFQFRPEDFPI